MQTQAQAIRTPPPNTPLSQAATAGDFGDPCRLPFWRDVLRELRLTRWPSTCEVGARTSVALSVLLFLTTFAALAQATCGVLLGALLSV